HGVVMHHDGRIVLADPGKKLMNSGRQVKLAELPLPGRFRAPRSIAPSLVMMPGQPMPMKGASF
ncbi:MAG: hypothetical protein J0I13_09015, partial [Rhizobiales bacterium]|nr:hypothetical protein [Hyphomicrobiales bacterium]